MHRPALPTQGYPELATASVTRITKTAAGRRARSPAPGRRAARRLVLGQAPEAASRRLICRGGTAAAVECGVTVALVDRPYRWRAGAPRPGSAARPGVDGRVEHLRQ